MLPYWLLYAVVAVPAFVGTGRWNRLSPAWISVGLLFILAIGFREQIGADWSSYLNHYYNAAITPLKEMKLSDPGYMLLNWLMAKLDWGIYGVNTVCGILFIFGLLSYCRRLPWPWLGFAVAVPYLIVVMAMGYTRQSVALGLFFLALADIERGYLLRYLVWIALGATFHKSAVLLAPVGILISQRRGWLWHSLTIAAVA